MKSHKIITPRDALSLIPSPSRIVLGHAAATPIRVIDAMIQEKQRFQDVEIVHMLSLGSAEYTHASMLGHFKHNALFVGGNTRDAIKRKQAEYTPCFFFEVPSLFENGALPIDVAIVQVSLPNEDGLCSFGVSCDYTKAAARCAEIVIAEMNQQMPWVHGNNTIHVDELDYIIPCDYPLACLEQAPIGDVERAIGQHCESLIKDGDTLQLGIGAIPDAVLMSLHDKKDLGIHSEMISDGVLSLIKSGVINNRLKPINTGKIIATFMMGSKNLYDFAHNNPMIELHPVEDVNHPMVIMKHDHFVSINSCLQVDFMGQVSAESIGFNQFSGVGGQVDYVRGASLARNGRSIIAMPSTASKERMSRIVPLLETGSAVTTTRNDVHFVVTEYGIAQLKGKSLSERARALINIAHPKFRDELTRAYHSRF